MERLHQFVAATVDGRRWIKCCRRKNPFRLPVETGPFLDNTDCLRSDDRGRGRDDPDAGLELPTGLPGHRPMRWIVLGSDKFVKPKRFSHYVVGFEKVPSIRHRARKSAAFPTNHRLPRGEASGQGRAKGLQDPFEKPTREKGPTPFSCVQPPEFDCGSIMDS